MKISAKITTTIGAAAILAMLAVPAMANTTTHGAVLVGNSLGIGNGTGDILLLARGGSGNGGGDKGSGSGSGDRDRGRDSSCDDGLASNGHQNGDQDGEPDRERDGSCEV